MKLTGIAWVAAFLALAPAGLRAAEAAAKPADGTISLVEAQAEVGKAAMDEKVMAATTARLSAADQKAFFAAVNKAISKLPRTIEFRMQRYVATCRAALTNAKRGNLAGMVAEMFATVEMTALPAVTEMCSQELFNRATDASKTFTDAQFAAIAKDIVHLVAQRTADEKTGAGRTTMAILMFVQASNGTPKDLSDQLVVEIGDKTQRELATSDWIPAATGENQEKTYDPILGYVGELIFPAHEIGLYTSTVLHQSNLLTSMATETGAISANSQTPATQSAGTTLKPGADSPRTSDPTKPWNPANGRGSTPEPQPYNNQTT